MSTQTIETGSLEILNGDLTVSGVITAFSITSTTNVVLSGSFTGSHTGTLVGSASFATQANTAISSSFVSGTYTAGWSATSPYAGLVGVPIGIYSSSTQLPIGVVSSSTQLPVGTVSSSVQINSGTFTGSFIGSASFAIQANTAISSSFVSGAYTAGWSAASPFTGLIGTPIGLVSSSLQFGTGSYTGSFTGTLLGTSSVAISASYAPASPAISASYALSASYASNGTFGSGSFTGSFTGSLLGTSSVAISASWAPGAYIPQTGIVSSSTQITASLVGTQIIVDTITAVTGTFISGVVAPYIRPASGNLIISSSTNVKTLVSASNNFYFSFGSGSRQFAITSGTNALGGNTDLTGYYLNTSVDDINILAGSPGGAVNRTSIIYGALGPSGIRSALEIYATGSPFGILDLMQDGGLVRIGVNAASPPIALQVNGTVSASFFSGNGSALTNIAASAAPIIGSISGGVQFANAGAFTSSAQLQLNIASGSLVMTGPTASVLFTMITTTASGTNETSTPPAGTIYLYGKSIAGRGMIKWRGPSGLDTPLQPLLGANKVGWFNPYGNTTTIQPFIGSSFTTFVGTATARPVTTTTVLTRMKRIGIVSATTAGTPQLSHTRLGASSTGVAQHTTGDGVGNGGFFFVARFGISDAAPVSSSNMFIGLNSSTAAPTSINPSTLTNCIGIGHYFPAVEPSSLKLYWGGSSAQTPIDLGTPNFSCSANIAYEFIAFSSPVSSATMGYRLTNLQTNVSTEGIVSGAIGTAIPASTTLLCVHAWRTTGGTALAVGLDICSLYIETDN